jgi:hypothetical protein
MSDPLSSNVVVQLRSDPTAALAAALILAGSFPDLVSWAMKAFGGKEGDSVRNGNAIHAANCELKGLSKERPSSKVMPGARSPEHRAKGHHNPREAAAEHDQALLALMRANPDASVTELIRLSGRPRNSAVLSLERLQKVGLVEHQGRGKWAPIDPDLLEVPAPRPAGWIAPLSGARAAKHTAAMRVPDRLTTADA